MGGSERLASSLAVIGEWVVDRPVGQGVTSTVFLARKGAQQGAVKVLGQGYGLREAEVLARLDRRWGPTWLDAGVSEQGPFIVTEWVEGEAVSAVPNRIAAWAIIHAVARGLAELHEAGVRHGDVKPANIVWHRRVPMRDVPQERAATLIDLGLATEFGESARGGTAAYAAPELRAGGDVGPRADVFALGVVVRELANGDAELVRLADAMCAPSAGARPAASWVAARAATVLSLQVDPAEATRARVSAVKRAYLAVRTRELSGASTVDESVQGCAREWIEGALDATRRLSPHIEPSGAVGPSSSMQRARWMVGLVGTSAAGWPVSTLDEGTLAERMSALAVRLPFGAWTYADLRGESRRASAPVDTNDDGADVVALGRPHPPAEIIEAVEQRAAGVSWTLREALVDALVRAGELGRAVLALDGASGPAAITRRAEVERRLGDAERAQDDAAKIVADLSVNPDLRARAAATMARLAWDAGRDDDAERLLAGHHGSSVAEVRALIAWRRGAFDAGVRVTSDALVDETDSLVRARLHAARGAVEHASGDVATALADYSRAVELAARAGAVADEATYLVGEAAAATDDGDMGHALASATRGALLLDRLGRPVEAARAWLVRAAALATVGDRHGADEAVAELDARDGTDARTRAYARWARVQTRAVDDPIARDEASVALGALRGSGDDELRAAARVLVWASDTLTAEQVAAFDRAASGCAKVAQWEWLGARAHAGATPDVLARLLA